MTSNGSTGQRLGANQCLVEGACPVFRHRGEVCSPWIGCPPGKGDGSSWSWRLQRPGAESSSWTAFDGNGTSREEGHTNSGGNHLGQSGQAGRLNLSGTDLASDLTSRQGMLSQTMPFLQQKHREVGKGGQWERITSDKLVILRHSQKERLIEQRLYVEGAGFDRDGEQSKIDITVLNGPDHVRCLHFLKHKIKIGPELAKHLNQVRKKVRGNGGNGRDPKSPSQGSVSDRSRDRQFPNCPQDSTSTLDDFSTRRCQQHPTGSPFEQLNPKVLLQLLDLGTKAGLADVNGLRCPTEVLVVSNRYRVLELAKSWSCHNQILSIV